MGWLGQVKQVTTPLDEAQIADLRAGDLVEITGVIYAARDAAHARMMAALDRGADLPFDLRGQIIYYVGPTLARPGEPIGSAGPTTSGRMDAYAPRLIELGRKGMIGKGYRNAAVREALVRYRAVYVAAVGGAGALLARRVTASELVAYEDLGPEAIRRLTVERFPVTVVHDIYGGDLYEAGKAAYRRAGHQ